MAITEQPPIANPSKATGPAEALDITPTTTSTLSSSAHQLLSEIRDIYDKLSELPSLAPSETVNAPLKRLVSLCVAPYSTEFTTYFFKVPGVDELCKKLRSIHSAAEGELEKYWVKRIMEETKPDLYFGDLQDYPYFHNYLDHTDLESSIINAFLDRRPLSSMTFLGSGPLPMTSLCFLREFPDTRIYNVDRDADAVDLGATLCRRMGWQHRMAFFHEDVTNLPLEAAWLNSQVIFLAALVGTDTKSKLEILRELAKRVQPRCLVVVRSTRGMRSAVSGKLCTVFEICRCGKPVDTGIPVVVSILELSEQVEATGFKILAEVHPWTKAATSFVLLRLKKEDTHEEFLCGLAESRVWGGV